MTSSSMEVEETEATNIHIPEDWSEAADTIAHGGAHTPTAFICGPKNSGKSTFSRHLLQVLLRRHKRVAYLDTDVGQPEFTPPGCLSLTVIDKETIDLQSHPERCFFFGDISSKRDPEIYLKYIIALYGYYHKQYHQLSTSEESVPLIINTPGWVKGIGYDVLVDMLHHITPTHVVNICVPSKTKNLPSGTFWTQDTDAESSVTLIEIKSASQDSSNRSIQVHKDSRHIRDLNLVTYFRQCFPNDLTINSIKKVAELLASHPPYEVSMSAINIKHLHCQVPEAEVFYSLNATIVGLAVSSEGSRHLPQCVGLGIVRGVDTVRRVVYIITPVLQHILEDVDVLLQGFIQIPTCLLQVQGCVSPYMASDVLSGI